MMNADGGATSGYTTAAAAAGDKKYKGVRRRKWGRWVSEIRLPNSRERIWLGSYDTPDKAARAFDAAFVCLRGHRAGQLNFPDSPPPRIPGGGRMLSPHEVQAAAASHANRALPGEAAAAPIAAEDSPAASDGMTAESGDAFDWSFMDTWLSPARASGAEFGPVIEDFTSEFFSTELEPTAAAEEVEDSSPNGLDSNSILWNF